MTQVAVVTGAGSGVGQASAIALAETGWTVVLAGRRIEALQETAAAIEALPGHSEAADVQVVDVSQPAAIDRLFSHVLTRYARLDLLFNNAGRSAPGPLEDIALEDWQAVVDTNLTGLFVCTQHAFRIMKNQRPMGGRIINNGSISAHTPRPFSAPYTATKHAVTGLTKQASLDGRRYNIACGQIDIGNALTPMTARMEGGVPQADGSLKPEPTMPVENVARAVAYMANMELEANVQFMTVMATQMPYVGRG